MKRILAPLVILMAIFAVGCPSPSSSDKSSPSSTIKTRVTGVSLNDDDIELAKTGTFQLIATVSPVDADNKSVTWTSSDVNVVTVSSTGFITAADYSGSDYKYATVTVETEDGGYTASADVVINPYRGIVNVDGISMTVTTASIGYKETYQAFVEFDPSDATNQSLTWASADDTIATVNSTGLITAVSPGTVDITATSAANTSCTATLALTVKEMTASDYLELGVTALSHSNFDGALYYINTAADMDTANLPEIALWKSLAILASTALSQEVQDIADAAGMTSFPTSLNDLFRGNFQNEMLLVDVEEYWYYDYTLGELVEEYDTDYFLAPEISIPSAVDFDDLLNEDMEGQNLLNFNEYAMAILYNLGHSYPDGATEPLTDISSLLSDAISDVVDCLSAVDTSTNIALSTDVMLPGIGDEELENMGWPTENGDFVDFIIGDAEFQAAIGALEVLNTLFYYSLSVTYDAEMDKLTSLMVDLIANKGEVSDTDLFPSYPMSGMLATYTDTSYYLGEAKDSLSSGLAHLYAAADEIVGRTEADSPFALSKNKLGEKIWSEIEEPLTDLAAFTNQLKASLDDDDETIVVSLENRSFPCSYTETTFVDGEPVAVEVNISALFKKSILDPANIVEADGNREPVIYDLSGTDPVKVTSMATIDENAYAIRITDYTLGGLLVLDKDDLTAFIGDMELPALEGDGNSYYVPMVSGDIVWSMYHGMSETTTNGEGDTVYGAGSFYWAMVRNMLLED